MSNTFFHSILPPLSLWPKAGYYKWPLNIWIMPLFDLTLHRFPPVCSIPTQQRESRPEQAKTIPHAHWEEWCSGTFSLSPSSSELKQKKGGKNAAFVHIYAWLVSHIDAHLCLSSTWQPFSPPPKDNIYYKRKQYILAWSKFVAHSRSS